MLVPAMTFAWWLVSMSSPEHHRAHAPFRTLERSERAERDEAEVSKSEAQATSDRQDHEQDTDETEAQPTEAADPGGSDDNAEGGERVPLKVVTPAVVRAARTFLDLPMGAERNAVIDGQRYVFVLEWHYHPPGFVGGPNGWHKGVTVYGVR